MRPFPSDHVTVVEVGDGLGLLGFECRLEAEVRVDEENPASIVAEGRISANPFAGVSRSLWRGAYAKLGGRAGGASRAHLVRSER